MNRTRGAAIPFAVLFALGLYVLAWTTFVVASSALRSARTAVTLSELRASAEARLAHEVARGPGAWAERVPVGATVHRGDSSGIESWEAGWTRLTPEVWLVDVIQWPGDGQMPGPPFGASGLAWVLDPATQVASLFDVTVLDSMAVTTRQAAPNLSVRGVDSISIGQLTVDEIAEGLIPLEGVVSPRLVIRSGKCDLTAAENLGDPTGTSVCRDRVSLRAVEERVEIRGGTGHALIAGRGDIVLAEGVLLKGLLLTTGRVRVAEGTFEGLVVAGQGLEIAPGSVVRADRALALSALEEFRRARQQGEFLREIRNLWGR